MTWHIAPSSIDDAPRLASILSDWIDRTDWMPRLQSRADDLSFVTGLIAAGAALTAFGDRVAAGFIACQGETVTALYVHAAMRNRGAGSALLRAAKSRHDRLCLWVFQANTGAHRLYLREGFVEDGRTAGNNAECLPDIRMVWHRWKDTPHA